jgi:hypothetical protein
MGSPSSDGNTVQKAEAVPTASAPCIPAQRLEIGLLRQGLLAGRPAAVAEGERSETASQGKRRGDHAQAGFDQGGPGDGG